MSQFLCSILFCITFPHFCFAQENFMQRILAERKANEGIELSNQGRYDDSYILLYEAWDYYDIHKYTMPIDYGNISLALAQNYLHRGEYGKAEELYLSAFNRLKKEFVDSLVFRSLLSDMGWLYVNLHNYDKANDYLFEAKYLYEKNLDLGYRYATLLSNYALLQSFMGNTLWAKMYVDLSKDIYMKSEEIEQHELPTILGNVAMVYAQLGFKDEALTTMQDARTLFGNDTKRRKGLPQLLNNIGTLFFEKKDYQTAINYIEESLNIDHSMINVLGSGFNLAWMQFCMKDKRCLNTSAMLSDSIISDVISKFAYLSNDEREIYWMENNNRLSIINAICAYENNNNYIGTIYNNSLFAKGLLMKTANKIKSQIEKSGDKRSVQMQSELSRLEQKLYDGNLAQESIASIKDSINYYDKELTKQNASYGLYKEELLPDWTRIRKFLSKDEVAIEFVQIPIVEGDSIQEPLKNRYYALVLKHNNAKPMLIPLATEDELKIAHDNIRNHLNDIVAIGEVGMDYYYVTDKALRERQQEIFRSFLDLANEYRVPIVMHVRDCEKKTVNIIEDYDEIPYFVFHCYGGSLKTAKRIMNKDNCFMSFSTMQKTIYFYLIQKSKIILIFKIITLITGLI